MIMNVFSQSTPRGGALIKVLRTRSVTTTTKVPPRCYRYSTTTPTASSGSFFGDLFMTNPKHNRSNSLSDPPPKDVTLLPGSRAFVECDREALIDLFHQYAVNCDTSGRYLDPKGLAAILKAVGENPDEKTLGRLFSRADVNGDGVIELEEFLISSDAILGDAPARIVLVVGGPGSGKGVLSKRLEAECGVVHLSSGDLLRDEVRRDTVLGRQVRDIMARGELVSSAVIVTLMRRVMRNHPGKRVLLDGFPRSLQNAHDLVTLCGTPELALHLGCDDTILMERIINRGIQSMDEHGGKRTDDNFQTALHRLRTYHKYHNSTMEWLREQHVPVVNLDCSGNSESVWDQLLAIGRLMRPATRIDTPSTVAVAAANADGSKKAAAANVAAANAAAAACMPGDHKERKSREEKEKNQSDRSAVA